MDAPYPSMHEMILGTSESGSIAIVYVCGLHFTQDSKAHACNSKCLGHDIVVKVLVG